MSLPAHETTAPAHAVRSYGSGWRTCSLSQAQVSWSLRSSSEFATLKKMFAAVVVQKVVVIVAASYTASSDDDTTPTYTLDFGLSERERSDIEPGAEPDFHSVTVGGSTPVTVRVAWGEGAEPFPKGMQLDLRLAEQRFHWPSFYVCHDHQEAENGLELVRYRVVVTVACTAQA